MRLPTFKFLLIQKQKNQAVDNLTALQIAAAPFNKDSYKQLFNNFMQMGIGKISVSSDIIKKDREAFRPILSKIQK